MLICLEPDKTTKNEEELLQLTFTGERGENKYFDKTQFIVTKNGKAGFLPEHSRTDGVAFDAFLTKLAYLYGR